MSAGMGIFNAIKAKKDAQRAAIEQGKKDSIAENQRATQENWFNKQYYQNLTDSADMQNIMRKQKEQAERQSEINAAAAATSGATADQMVAANSSINKAVADTYANIGALSEQRRADLSKGRTDFVNSYAANLLGNRDAMSSIYGNAANQESNASSNLLNGAALSFMSGFGNLHNKNWKQAQVTPDVTPVQSAPDGTPTK